MCAADPNRIERSLAPFFFNLMTVVSANSGCHETKSARFSRSPIFCRCAHSWPRVIWAEAQETLSFICVGATPGFSVGQAVLAQELTEWKFEAVFFQQSKVCPRLVPSKCPRWYEFSKDFKMREVWNCLSVSVAKKVRANLRCSTRTGEND